MRRSFCACRRSSSYMQEWIVAGGRRLVVLFEGRDTAGKDGVDQAHHRLPEPANLPRRARSPRRASASARSGSSSATSRICRRRGEIVLFDRSWYNRAGVEHVMGYCTQERVRRVPALLPAVRAGAAERRDPARQVLAVDQRRRAGAQLREASVRSAQALEVQPDRSRRPAAALGRLRGGQGPHVRATPTPTSSPWYVVEADDKRTRAPEPHQPPAARSCPTSIRTSPSPRSCRRRQKSQVRAPAASRP